MVASFPSVFSEDETMCLDNAGYNFGHNGTRIGTLSGFVFHVGPSRMAWIGALRIIMI